MSPLTEIKANLEFNCVHETIPTPTAEADLIFKYARWLQKNNVLKQDKEVYHEVERLYRIAAENGHFKANINLQNGAIRGQFEVKGKERLRLSQSLIESGIATGYYFVALYLNRGASGLQQDSEMALRYFRKAADQGSALAQYHVGDKLEPIDIAPHVAVKMYRCAAEQGNGKAALALGLMLSTRGQYKDALEAFQLGVAAGNDTSSSFIEEGFRGPLPDNRMYYLGQEQDLERAERYKKVWRFLANYSYANPSVPEIDEILPLPPAKLPAWDGKLQWLEAHLANVPPEKPSDALITQLANAMVLDPANGHPMPGSPSFSQANFPMQICYPGEACPQAGYWKVIWPRLRNVRPQEVIRHFDEGEVFPMQTVERYHLRPWPFSDKTTFRLEAVEWGLLG